MNLREKFNKITKEEIKEMRKNQKEWSEHIDINFPDEWGFEVVGRTILHYIRIACPFNRTMYPKLTTFMREHGYEINKYWTRLQENGEGYPYMTFKKENAPSLEFVFFDFQEGSVCTRKLIGNTTKEVPVYEFVCT